METGTIFNYYQRCPTLLRRPSRQPETAVDRPRDAPPEERLISRTVFSQVIVTFALRYVRCATFFPTVGVISAG